MYSIIPIYAGHKGFFFWCGLIDYTRFFTFKSNLFASTSSFALQQETSSYWRHTAIHIPLIYIYSVIAWGQRHENGFLQLAVKDILQDFLSMWTNSTDEAVGNNTPISPRNGQAETKKMSSWTSSFLTKSAVFIKPLKRYIFWNLTGILVHWSIITSQRFLTPW